MGIEDMFLRNICDPEILQKSDFTNYGLSCFLFEFPFYCTMFTTKTAI